MKNWCPLKLWACWHHMHATCTLHTMISARSFIVGRLDMKIGHVFVTYIPTFNSLDLKEWALPVTLLCSCMQCSCSELKIATTPVNCITYIMYILLYCLHVYVHRIHCVDYTVLRSTILPTIPVLFYHHSVTQRSTDVFDQACYS